MTVSGLPVAAFAAQHKAEIIQLDRLAELVTGLSRGWWWKGYTQLW